MAFALLIFASALAAVRCLPFVDNCPPFEPVKDFDMQKFSGEWFEMARTWGKEPMTTKCHTENYTVKAEPNITIDASFVDIKSNRALYTNGSAITVNETNGVWYYVFPKVYGVGTMAILDTDYVNFAILATCQPVDSYALEYSWIVSRNRMLTEEQKAMFTTQYGNKYFGTPRVVFIDQTDCA